MCILYLIPLHTRPATAHMPEGDLPEDGWRDPAETPPVAVQRSDFVKPCYRLGQTRTQLRELVKIRLDPLIPLSQFLRMNRYFSSKYCTHLILDLVSDSDAPLSVDDFKRAMSHFTATRAGRSRDYPLYLLRVPENYYARAIHYKLNIGTDHQTDELLTRLLKIAHAVGLDGFDFELTADIEAPSRSHFLREMNEVAKRLAQRKSKLGRPFQTTLYCADYRVPMAWPEGMNVRSSEVYTQFLTVDIEWVYRFGDVLPPNDDELKEEQDWVLKYWIPTRWHIRNYFLHLSNLMGGTNLVAKYPGKGVPFNIYPENYVRDANTDVEVSGWQDG